MATLRLVTAATVANPNVHDIYLDDSGQVEIIGADINSTESYALAIAQRIKTRILLIKGEWYLDQRVGTPWRERIWKKGVTAETVRRVIREVVETTPGVEEVRSLDVSLDAAARTATITNLVAVTDMRSTVTITQLDDPMIIEVPND